MKVTSDLHLHSRYSRACSKDINLQNLEKYAKLKGLNLLGTGDFQHPKWLPELKKELTDNGKGIMLTKTGFPFVLQTEIALVYTQDGKGRRIHNIVLAPNFQVADQMVEYLLKKGRIDYDGRPIFKIHCPQFVEELKKISPEIEIIPAHCLLPGTYLHSESGLKKIEEVSQADKVITHRGRIRKVIKTYKRVYKGEVYKIIPWYFREGLTTTPEHPFFAIKSFKKCSWTKGVCKPLCADKTCKNRKYEKYSPLWVQAKDLEEGDFLIYPRMKNVKDADYIKISDFIKNPILDSTFVGIKGNRTKFIKNQIRINKEFCRLAGYYLAEGYSIRNEAIGFSFNKKEKEYIVDVINLMNELFGLPHTKIDERKGADIIFHSHILNEFFKRLFYIGGENRAWNKSVPEFMLGLSKEKQTELFRGWWRGDGGYTVSHELASQMKSICIRLGIIPSISVDSAEKFTARGKHFIGNRKISTIHDTYIFSNLSFFEEKELLKDKSFKKFVNRRNMKHGWIDDNFIYLPIRKIEIRDYQGDVYNLEVEEDNSYLTEYVAVHNCWTPWFSVFGSMSGFNSLKECFQEQTKHIHAIETGLSSDPGMNRRLSQLDNISLVSFSDSHSAYPWRIGREATTLEMKELSYAELIKAIKENIIETIEYFPEEGKYHFDGHRTCGVSMSPKESNTVKKICPACKKQMTIGVANRIEELADREEPANAKPYRNLIPLSEIISHVVD
ncbi:MAG: hypothetical protein NTW67_06470 [Candidatus Woesearchaeota archaeon]|nr:hypothetical protein [Candidatus Woesearchaeota archaeon]